MPLFCFFFIKVGTKDPEERRSQPLMLGLFFFGSVSLTAASIGPAAVCHKKEKKKNGYEIQSGSLRFVKMLVWTFCEHKVS